MAIIKQFDKRTGIVYAYESISYYVPELRQSRSKRRLIGRVDPQSGEIVPTGKRGRPRKSGAAVPESTQASSITRLELENTRAKQELIEAKRTNQELTNEVKELKRQITATSKFVSEMVSAVNHLSDIMNQAATRFPVDLDELS